MSDGLALLRIAARQWARVPLVATIATVSLGVGIGAAAAIFALADAVYMRRLPVAKPDGFVQICSHADDVAGGRSSVYAVTVWDAFHDTQPVFDDVAAAAIGPVRLALDGEARFAQALYVSGSLFRLLGVPVVVGRAILPSDDTAGAEPVAVIDYAFWRRELGGREPVVGTRTTIDGQPVEIVGVTAPPFFGIDVGRRMQIYMPIAPTRNTGTRGSAGPRAESVMIFGRLRAGQSQAQAREALRAWQPAWRAAVLPLGDEAREQLADPLDVISAINGVSRLRTDSGRPLALLALAVGFVLAIACANVAALMSARFADRRIDLWTRSALGASGRQLVTGLMVEACLLCAGGATLGAALAVWFARILLPALAMQPSLLEPAQPYLAVALDWRVVAVGVVLALVTAAATGFPAAISALRGTHALRPGALGEVRTTTAASRRMLLTLVTGQLALALVLVSSAGGLVRSFLALTLQPTGVDIDRVLLASLDGPIFEAAPSVAAAQVNDLCDRLARLPGVQAVSASTVTPMSGIIMLARLQVPGYIGRGNAAGATAVNRVTPAFFTTFGTPIVAGRGFEVRDGAGQRNVAIVNRAFERQFFGGQSAVGRLINVGGRNLQQLQIVGVAATAKYMTLRDDERPVVYRPLQQSMPAGPQQLRLAFRTTEPNRIRGAVLAELRRFDPQLTLEFRTLYDEVASSVQRERTLAWSGSLVAVLALGMAALGLYGTFSNMVTRRRREIAIRLALGASRRSVHLLVARAAAAAVVIGSVVGVAGLVVSARLVQSLVYGVRVLDPWTVTGTLAVLIAVAVAATAIPIRRAGLVDPMQTLRSE